MVGQLPLEQHIGVRIPGGQPMLTGVSPHHPLKSTLQCPCCHPHPSNWPAIPERRCEKQRSSTCPDNAGFPPVFLSLDHRNSLAFVVPPPEVESHRYCADRSRSRQAGKFEYRCGGGHIAGLCELHKHLNSLPRLPPLRCRHARGAIVMLPRLGDSSLKKYLRHHAFVLVAQQMTMENRYSADDRIGIVRPRNQLGRHQLVNRGWQASRSGLVSMTRLWGGNHVRQHHRRFGSPMAPYPARAAHRGITSELHGGDAYAALTPLFWEHVNPYGRFDLDMNTRLALA